MIVWAYRQSGGTYFLSFRLYSGIVTVESHDFGVSEGNCGTAMKVTKRAIVLGCHSDSNGTGRITIYSRPLKTANDPSLIAEFTGPYQGAGLGRNVSAIEATDTFGT